MEDSEGNKVQDDSPFNLRQEQFLEDVLLSRFRDELNIQRQLIVKSLREDVVNLLHLAREDKETSIFEDFSSCTPEAPELSTPQARASAMMGLTEIGTTEHPSDTLIPEDPNVCLTPGQALQNVQDVLHRDLGLYDPDCKSIFGSAESWLLRAIHSKRFRTTMSFLILANAIEIGFRTEAELVATMEGVEVGNFWLWYVIEVSFTSIFLLELVLRVYAHGRSFFEGSGRNWHILDTALVVQAVCNLVFEQVLGKEFPNLLFIRVLRVMRFFRVLRVLRPMRHFLTFRIMLISLGSSFVSLVFVLLMLFFIIYLFTIIMAHCIMSEFESFDLHLQERQQLRNAYGDISQTSFSLFMAITGGKDWADFYVPLANLPGLSAAVFLCYIFFAVFGVLNVVTSMFVDSINKASTSDHHYAIQCQIAQDESYVKACRDFFFRADKNGSGRLSWEELEQYLRLPENKAYLETLELDEKQAQALYTLLDTNADNSVGIEIFVRGCQRLRGSAKAIDVGLLLYELNRFNAEFKHSIGLVEQKLAAISARAGRKVTMLRQSPSHHWKL